jgi:glycosyltransferase involved in cell wall biosynthesis
MSKTVTEPNKIRLLQFVTIFAVGGTETQVIKLAQGLHSSGFEQHFACLKRFGQLLKEVEALRIPIAEYKISSLYHPKVLKEQMKFARYIKHNLIQIVHAYGFYGNVFAIPAAWLAGAPVIIASIRDTGGYQTPTQDLVHKLMCRLADRIVVNAEAIRQWLIAEGYNPEKITVIRNGVDLSRFTTKTRGSKLRAELGVPQDAPLIAVLARLHPVKGIEYFLEAATIVRRRFPEARFLIVGESRTVVNGQIVDSPYKRELEGSAVRLGLGDRAVFTGLRLDVPEMLSEITVSVLPCISSEG